MKEALLAQPPQAFIKPDPLPASRPVFSGQYVQDGQAHSILYYVDKDDPTGPPPTNPYDDPQFERWETAVRAWTAANPGRISTTTEEVPPPALIEEEEPEPGVTP